MAFETAFTMDTSSIKYGPGVTREVDTLRSLIIPSSWEQAPEEESLSLNHLPLFRRGTSRTTLRNA
jgi:hypothetical protein